MEKKGMKKDIYYSWFFENGEPMKKEFIELEELENKTFKVVHIKKIKNIKIIKLDQYFKLLDKLEKEFYRSLD